MMFLKYNGDLVNVNGHNIHIFRQGNISKPKILLMSGSGTIASVYDFKVLYEKLSKSFRVIVMKKATSDLRIIKRLFLYTPHFVSEMNLHQYVKFLIGFFLIHIIEKIHNVRIGHAPIGIGEAHLTFFYFGETCIVFH